MDKVDPVIRNVVPTMTVAEVFDVAPCMLNTFSLLLLVPYEWQDVVPPPNVAQTFDVGVAVVIA